MLEFNNDVLEIEISGIRKFFNLISDKKDVVSLTIGQPDFPTPEHIKEFAKKSIDQEYTKYSHNAGFLDLRQAISNWMDIKYSLKYNPLDEIIVTAGSSEALDISFRAILNPDDEVILPGPVYPGYEPLIKMSKAKTILIDTTSTDFKLTPELIDEYITAKTKAIVLPYPSNPTGTVLSYNELTELANYLMNKDIFIIADELYSELVFGQKHYSIASFNGLREKTIIITGISKSHSMTGWRIGVLLAPSYIAKHILKVHQYNVTCASSISQRAALEAFSNGFDDAYPMRDAYEKRLKLAYKELSEMGFDVNEPKGTFYIFPKITQSTMNSFDLALDLVEKAKVAVIPGSAFSHLGEGYLRLSCACSYENLEKGLKRMKTYFQHKKVD
jgi:aminotransferase